jgi:hypothetical protein
LDSRLEGCGTRVIDGLFFNPWDLDSRLEGCGTRVINGLFFKFLKDKDRRFKTNLTLSLIL